MVMYILTYIQNWEVLHIGMEFTDDKDFRSLIVMN